jgi:hypothetical protein
MQPQENLRNEEGRTGLRLAALTFATYVSLDRLACTSRPLLARQVVAFPLWRLFPDPYRHVDRSVGIGPNGVLFGLVSIH